MKKGITETIIFALAACAVAVIMGLAKGIPWTISVPVAAVFFVLCVIISIAQEHSNKKSFKTAADLENGIAFKNENQHKHYEKWKEQKPHFEKPKGSMLGDIIIRYRSWSIAWEIIGGLILLFILWIVYNELEIYVRYILLGGAIILFYLAFSDIFGIRARRLYNRLTSLPDFADIEKSYMENVLIGSPKNWISVGREYLILVTPKIIIPIHHNRAAVIRRAYIVGETNYNGALTSAASGSEKHFIRVYMTSSVDAREYALPVYYSVLLDKYLAELAFEMLADLGYPADPSIDAR